MSHHHQEIGPYIVGDQGYVLSKNILIPYAKNEVIDDSDRKHFNFCQSSTRMAVERSFGILKKRFSLLESKFCNKYTIIFNCVNLKLKLRTNGRRPGYLP